MAYCIDDTIAAIASPPGAGLRGILRVSGPTAVEVIARLAPAIVPSDGQSRRKSTYSVKVSIQPNGVSSTVPCRALVWRTPRSYTRQPTVELHLIGSPPILEAVLESVCQHGARLAGPGEFTLRAFLAGRIDLPQAEAVLGVIDAHSNEELCVALDQLAGGLSSSLARVRGELLDVCAELEAGLDFVEEDIEFIEPAELQSRLESLEEGMSAILAKMDSRRMDTRCYRVVLIGAPNVGKSSLLNRISGCPAALVSPVPGTTRDYVHQAIRLPSHDCMFVDTAGIEPDATGVDSVAQGMTAAQIESSDLILMCHDSSRPPWHLPPPIESLVLGKATIHVLTKCDLPRRLDFKSTCVATSSLRDDGITELAECITAALGHDGTENHRIVDTTVSRGRESTRLAMESIREARSIAENRGGDELISAELRAALDHLGVIIGAVYTDDVLDRVFSRFCIGK